jgi:DNA-directed RNA polymerase subunit E'/Rpb7
MTTYYSNEILTEKIQINFNEINTKDINTKIYSILKNKVENKCYKSGYIIQNSTKIINKTLGKIVNYDSNSMIEYNIRFSVKIIKPTIDDIIECYISEKNKLGILAYIKYKDIIENGNNNGISESPLLIIIPMETISDIDKYEINMKIKVVVKATRIKFDANKIQVIGNIED